MKRLLRWTLACAVGEALGLTLSGAVAALVIPLLVESDVSGPGAHRVIMLAAGAVEGAALGAVQAAGLRAWRVRVGLPSFIAASAVGMAVSWAVGTAIGGDVTDGDPNALVLFALVSGIAIGVLLGIAQAIVLYRHPRRARAWIVANTIGWPLAMVASTIGANALPPGDYGPTALALGLATGAAMGAVVGISTGVALSMTE